MRFIKQYSTIFIPLVSALVFIGVAYGTVVSQVDNLDEEVKKLASTDIKILDEQKSLSRDVTILTTKMDILNNNSNKILDKLEGR